MQLRLRFNAGGLAVAIVAASGSLGLGLLGIIVVSEARHRRLLQFRLADSHAFLACGGQSRPRFLIRAASLTPTRGLLDA